MIYERFLQYKKKNPFTVPEGYFDELTGRITGRIEKQKEVLRIWNNLSTNEQETVMSMLRGLRK